MRTQWPCSKCGFAYSSTWRTEHPSKPVVCDACTSMEKNDYDDEQEYVDDDDESIGSSHDSGHSLSQIISQDYDDVLFGNLPLHETNIRIVHDQRSFGLHENDHDAIYGGSSSKSLLEDDMQIKNEHDYEVLVKEETTTLWEPKSVNKKKRSKLPQYTISPVERFANQLQYQVLQQDPKLNNVSANEHLQPTYGNGRPRYDDVLIYERSCNFVSRDEIGIGSALLSPTIKDINKHPGDYSVTERLVKIEPYTGDIDCACNLFDVPITSSSM